MPTSLGGREEGEEEEEEGGLALDGSRGLMVEGFAIAPEHRCSALDTTCDLIVEGFALLDGGGAASVAGGAETEGDPPRRRGSCAGRRRLERMAARDDHTSWWLSQPAANSVRSASTCDDGETEPTDSCCSSPVSFVLD